MPEISTVIELGNLKNSCISPVAYKKTANGSESVNVKEKLTKAIPVKTDQKTKTYDIATWKKNKSFESTVVEKKVPIAVTDKPAFVSKDNEADKEAKMSYVKSESKQGLPINENKIATKAGPAIVNCGVNKNLNGDVGDAAKLTVQQPTTAKSGKHWITGDKDVAKLTNENLTPASILTSSSQTKIKATKESSRERPSETKYGQTSVIKDKILVSGNQVRGKNIAENDVINESTTSPQKWGESSGKDQLGHRDVVLAHKKEESVNELQPKLNSSTNNPANPTGKVSLSRRIIAKPRGKPKGKVGSRIRRSHIATPKAVQVASGGRINLTTPKVSSTSRMIKKMGRRGLTGTSTRKSDKDRRKKRRKVEERKNDLQHLQACNADLRRRIKNVKSKLFSETKSFRAYKSARQTEELQRRKKRTKVIAKQTELRYADRSIDFSKKSRRQHLSRRNHKVAG